MCVYIYYGYILYIHIYIFSTHTHTLSVQYVQEYGEGAAGARGGARGGVLDAPVTLAAIMHQCDAEGRCL